MFLKRFDRNNNLIKVAGHKMKFFYFDTFMCLFEEVFLKEEYLFKADNDCPLIIDCGSNIGMSLFYFKTIYPNSRIIAFEPDPQTFECLKANVEMNSFCDVSVHQLALTNFEGEISFFTDQSNPGSTIMSTVKERYPKNEVSVPAGKLSSYIDQEVDFLKMDIEGAEQSVFQDLRDSGKLNFIKKMVIEYHHHIDITKDDFSSFLQVLEGANFGYQIEGGIHRPLGESKFQNIIVYCYQK